MKKHLTAIAFILGFGLLSFIFLMIVLPSIGFFFGGAIHPVWSILSLLLSGGLIYYLCFKHKIPVPWVWVMVSFLMIIGSVAVASTTIDHSWDGNSYHKTAVGELVHGWNPVHQDINSFNSSNANSFKLIGENGLDRKSDELWINHYPKASWFFAANVYVITGSIESGKALAILTGLIIFFFAFGYLSQRLNRNQALIISLLLAFNPISVSQFFSFYVDGVMGILLVLLILACTLLIDAKAKVPARQWLLYGTILMAIVIVINLKFTGLVYAAIILGCYWLYWVGRRQWQTVIRATVVGAIAVLIGLLVVGASSYAKNYLSNGNPLYPLMGKDKVNFIINEEPIGYENMTNLERFVMANLAPTMQINHQESIEQGAPQPKIPFIVGQLGEIGILYAVDVRQGGYGIWFGGILILSILAGVYAIIRYGRASRKVLPLFLLPLAAILLCIMLVNATWWARYMPHLVLFPLIVVTALYIKRETVLPNILVFAMLFNVTLTGLVGLQGQFKFQGEVQQKVGEHIRCDASKPTKLYSGIGQDGFLYNLHDRCKSLQLLTPDEFAMTAKESRADIIKGIQVIK